MHYSFYVFFHYSAIQTALRLQSEGKSSLHHELKLKRRIQRENSQRERSRSARSSCSSRGSQSDDLTIHETEKTEKEKDKQDLEIENIIKVSEGYKNLFFKYLFNYIMHQTICGSDYLTTS